MNSGEIRPGYIERAKTIQARRRYSMTGWMAELNRAHARDPKTWTLSVVAEILAALNDTQLPRPAPRPGKGIYQ